MGIGHRVTRTNYPRIKKQNKNLDDYEKPKKRVFISFHMENEFQINLLRHQAKSDKFQVEFTDYSVKEPFDEKWKTQCTERLKQCSIVFCMIGHETHQRPAVLWELNKAYELGKKVVGIRVHKNVKDKIPEPLRKHKAKIINWNMEEIQDELDEE